jgi:DNA-binding transcriptional LysR family regulator
VDEAIAPLAGIRFADLAIFIAVARRGSITGAARVLALNPSHVSKVISRLERELHSTLLHRGRLGAALTDAGRRILPELEDVVERLRRLSYASRELPPELTIGVSNELSAAVLPRIAASVPGIRLRIVEIQVAADLGTLVADATVDVLVAEALDGLPSQWVTAPVGKIRRTLLGAPALLATLGRPPLPAASVRNTPLVTVGPAHMHDRCPIPSHESLPGHEAPSLELALSIAARSGQLIFVSELAARPYLHAGALVEIPVAGCVVFENVSVACDGNRVRARVFKTIQNAVRAVLGEAGSLQLRRQ